MNKMFTMWLALSVLGRVAVGTPEKYVFASFNNARTTSLVSTWVHAHGTDVKYMRARGLLCNPRTFSIVAVPDEPGRDHISILICERRPKSHVLRMCLWAVQDLQTREECTRQASIWHNRNLANGKTFVVDRVD